MPFDDERAARLGEVASLCDQIDAARAQVSHLAERRRQVVEELRSLGVPVQQTAKFVGRSRSSLMQAQH